MPSFHVTGLGGIPFWINRIIAVVNPPEMEEPQPTEETRGKQSVFPGWKEDSSVSTPKQTVIQSRNNVYLEADKLPAA